MATPPNRASGLYYLFLSKLETLKSSSSTSQSSSSSRSGVASDIDMKAIVAAAKRFVATKFGPNMKTISCGGGPTPNLVIQFMKDAMGTDVSVTDSYGATEIGAICSNNQPVYSKGVMLRVKNFVTGAECTKQGEAGEAWVSSKSISPGYYENPVQTASSFVADGVDETGNPRMWYRTGDLVKITDEGTTKEANFQKFWVPTIKILGRIASAVRLRSGKIVSPDVLEGLFCVSPLLANIYIHGNSNTDQLVAVVSLANVSSSSSSSSNGGGDMTQSERYDMTQRVLTEILEVGKSNSLSECEIPKKVYIDSEAWTVENGMLNGSMKKNRGVFASKFAEAIEKLH